MTKRREQKPLYQLIAVLSMASVTLLQAEKNPSAGAEWFGSWPEGKTPQVIGKRLSEEFLSRDLPHNRHVLYPEVIAWNGSLMLTQLTGETELNQKLIREFDYLLTPEGYKHLNKSTPDLDLRVFGSLAIEIYLQTKDERYQKLGLFYADAQWKQPRPDGLSREARFWVDDMYMIGMLQTHAYRATENTLYLDRCSQLAVAYLEKLQQPNGLFFHASDSPFHWGRGNGWFAAGMTEILRALPETHTNRPAIMAGYTKMMKSLLTYQGTTGLWKQLVDKPESWDETSSSGMFSYALVTGVKEGWLESKTYGPAARKAWLALTDCINEKNQVRDVCVGTYTSFSQVGGDMEKQYVYYMKRPRVVGDLHAQASVLWTACALLR